MRWIATSFCLIGLLLCVVAISPGVGQDQEPAAAEPSAPSVLPPGRPDRGLSLFIEKGCHQCHTAGSAKLPPVDLAPRLVIGLGGDLHATWTRDDFARAIVNPRHLVSEDYRIAMMRLGENFKAETSPMPEFGDMLLVSELVHLAAFLETLSE